MTDGPSVHRRQLGRWLQSLREATGKTQGQVAHERRWDTSKVSRIETGRSRVHPSDLMVLMDLYNVKGKATRDDMLKLSEEARSDRGGFVTAHDVRLRPGGYVSFERDATAITEWQPGIVPGLLQTEAYALALLRAGMPRAQTHELSARVQIRVDRQRRLSETHPPLFTALVDEAVLHRQVGGPAVHLEQLRFIQQQVRRPNIALRIVPLAAPDNPLPHGHATLLEFATSPDLNLIYMEGIAGDYYATKDHEYARYRELLDKVVQLSLSKAKSNTLLAEVTSKYATDDES